MGGICAVKDQAVRGSVYRRYDVMHVYSFLYGGACSPIPPEKLRFSCVDAGVAVSYAMIQRFLGLHLSVNTIKRGQPMVATRIEELFCV